MDDDIKIEKGIPLPTPSRGNGPSSKYPWGLMEIGDSFFVAVTEKTKRGKVQSRLGQVGRGGQFGIKVATRQVDNGVRVWRTA